MQDKPKFNELGEELMDDTPVASALKFKPRSQFSDIRRQIANEISRQAAARQLETLQEADDFDVGDDFDPTSPYEEHFDPDTGQSNFDVPFKEEKPMEQAKPAKPSKDEKPDSATEA